MSYWLRDIARWVGGVLVAIIGVVLIIYGIGWLAIALDRHACEETGRQSSVETKYPNGSTGCLVKINDRWVPIDNWRETP